VAVISEHHKHDRYIIKPVVKRILKDLNKPKAEVDILDDPDLGGVSRALDVKNVARIIARNPMYGLFLIIVDSDCEEGRPVALENCVTKTAGASGKAVIGCLAVEELEIWALALHKKELPDRWENVQQCCDPKETYFEPLVSKQRWPTAVGKGRVAAMQAIFGQWKSLVDRCPELKKLRSNIKSWLEELASQ
jgi:hypothetical protein